MQRSVCLVVTMMFWAALGADRAAASKLVVYIDTPHGLYDFDTVTGEFTVRALVAGSERFFGMDRRPGDGAVFAADLGSGGLWKVDIDTGATHKVGTLTPAIDNPEGIAFHPVTGELFVGSVFGDLYKVDPRTAATVFIGASGHGLRGHIFTPDGSRMLAVSEGDGGLYQVDPATGVALQIGSNAVSTLPEDLAFTPDGRLFVTDYFGSIHEVDPQTGAARFVGDVGPRYGLLGAVAVPEPATGLILCAAALMQLRQPKRRRGPILRERLCRGASLHQQLPPISVL